MLNSHTADPLRAHTFQPMPEKTDTGFHFNSGAVIAEKAKPALSVYAISFQSVNGKATGVWSRSFGIVLLGPLPFPKTLEMHSFEG